MSGSGSGWRIPPTQHPVHQCPSGYNPAAVINMQERQRLSINQCYLPGMLFVVAYSWSVCPLGHPYLKWLSNSICFSILEVFVLHINLHAVHGKNTTVCHSWRIIVLCFKTSDELSVLFLYLNTVITLSYAQRRAGNVPGESMLPSLSRSPDGIILKTFKMYPLHPSDKEPWKASMKREGETKVGWWLVCSSHSRVPIRNATLVKHQRSMASCYAPQCIMELLPKPETMLSTKKSSQCRFNDLLLKWKCLIVLIKLLLWLHPR